MLSRSLLGVAAVTISLTSFASARTEVVFTGSHNPAQAFVRVEKPAEAPYTLVRQDVKKIAEQPAVRVGSRTVVPGR